jgi:hypothetical protein
MVEDPRTPAGAGRLRRLNEPRPVVVETTANNEPAAVLWQGRLQAVAAIHDRWRIDDEWWRSEISRRYYAVQLANGSRLVVYCDLVTGNWHVQPYRGPQLERLWRGKPL